MYIYRQYLLIKVAEVLAKFHVLTVILRNRNTLYFVHNYQYIGLVKYVAQRDRNGWGFLVFHFI